VLEDLVDGRPLRWIIFQDASDQALGCLGDRNCFWEAVLSESDFFVSSLHIVSFKWWLSDDEGVNNNTERPNIYLIRVTLFALEHLWGNIVGRTTNRSLSLTVELKLGGESEIANFDFHLVVQEQISELKISMNDSVRV